MTTYHFHQNLVWPIGAGGAVKVAKRQRVTVTDPATSAVPTGLAQAGVAAPTGVVTSDADGVLEFETTDVGVVDLDGPGGFETRIEALELIGTGGGGGGGTTDAGVATQINTGSNTQTAGDKRWQRGVNVKRYGAVGDGVTNDSTAIASCLAANQGKAIYFPAGTYLVSSATRLALTANFTSLVGDGMLLSRIKFTHASGGVDIGNGTDNIYQNFINNIALIGTTSTTTTLLHCRNMYEPQWQNFSLEQAAGELIRLHNCGQLDVDEIRWGTCTTGMRITGTVTPVMNMRLCNFYNMVDAIRMEGSGIGRLKMTDSYTEAVVNLMTIDAPGTAVSIGEIIFSDVHPFKNPAVEGEPGILPAVAATRNLRFLKVSNASEVNNQQFRIDGCYLDAQSSTAPLIDFTAVNNATATFRCSIRHTNVLISGTQPLVDVHPSQAWFLFQVMVHDIKDGAGNFDTARWSKSPYATGGTWLKPLVLEGVASPEGSVTAPAGSSFQRSDGSALALYIKTSGVGNTGWSAVAMSGSDTTEAPMTFRSTDAINDDFGVSIVQVQKSFLDTTNPGMVTAASNGAGQFRTTGPFGSFLASNVAGTAVIAYGNAAVEALVGNDIPLYPATDNDNVIIARGTLLHRSYTTAGRPSAVTAGAGAEYYDLTLSKPGYSDGAVWRDAAGTAI